MFLYARAPGAGDSLRAEGLLVGNRQRGLTFGAELLVRLVDGGFQLLRALRAVEIRDRVVDVLHESIDLLTGLDRCVLQRLQRVSPKLLRDVLSLWCRGQLLGGLRLPCRDIELGEHRIAVGQVLQELISRHALYCLRSCLKSVLLLGQGFRQPLLGRPQLCDQLGLYAQPCRTDAALFEQRGLRRLQRGSDVLEPARQRYAGYHLRD